MDGKTALQRLEALKGRRTSFDAQWQEVKDRCFPHGADFTSSRSQGQKTNLEMFDSTAAVDLERFAAVMESMLTPRQQRWHRLRSTVDELNDQEEVREWFDTVTKALFRVRDAPLADFYGQSHEGYKSIGAYGNRCTYVYEDASNVIRYRNCHVGSTWIALDEHRRVDTVYHTFKLSAAAAVRQWPQTASDKMRALAERQPFEQVEVLHLVQPRGAGYEPGRAGDNGKPYLAMEVQVDDGTVLSTGGYYELPYIFSRYTTNSDEDYGRGPCMLVLPDIKTLNAQERALLRSAEKIADPPLLLLDDGVFGWQGRDVTLTPGGLNYGGLDREGRQTIQPMVTGGRPEMTLEMMERKRQTIHDALLVSLFQILVENPGMTATEVLHRAQEKGMLLAPSVGRQQSEMLGPMIEREVAILFRNGLLPPIPQALLEADGEYKIEYESPATRYQRSEEVLAFQRSIEAWAPLLQVNPSLLENVDMDQGFRETLEINGVPAKWIKSREDVDRAREAQAEVAEQEAAAEQAPGAADTIKKLAEAANKAGVRPAA
ncbi:MAG TPA: portal protein [Steroidobacteraceae bacterium]|nr:portal protein [Steroidobacteraceae bacterium]